MEKTLQIAFHLGVDNFVGSEDWINRFKSTHNIVCNTAVGESRSVYSETVDDWKNDCCCMILTNVTSVTYLIFIRQVCLSIYSLVQALYLVEATAMVEQNQNSESHCSLHVMLMIIMNQL
jgi:hypothetical protein